MLARLRSRLSFANVVAALALVVALSTGGAYAAATITGDDVVDNSLTGADVKGRGGSAPVDGSLTGVDISGQAANPAAGIPFVQGTLTGADVRDGSLGGVDVTDSSLAASDIAQGAVGSSEVTNGSLQTQDFASGVLASFRAYGHIDGTTHTRDRNVVSVTNDAPGHFCITLAGGIDPGKSAPVATPDKVGSSTGFGTNTNQAIVEVLSSVFNCNPGQLEVLTARRQQTTSTVNGQQVVTSVDNVLHNEPFFFVLP